MNSRASAAYADDNQLSKKTIEHVTPPPPTTASVLIANKQKEQKKAADRPTSSKIVDRPTTSRVADRPTHFISARHDAQPNPPSPSVQIPLRSVAAATGVNRYANINSGNAPLGLDHLAHLDKLYMRQPTHNGKVVNSLFMIRMSNGQQIYSALEEYDSCLRSNIITKKSFGFEVTVFDSRDRPIMRLSRKYKCICSGLCWFANLCDGCTHEFWVEAPIGSEIGYVKQIGSKFKPTFAIFDEGNKQILTARGPYAHCFMGGICCPGYDRYKFKLYSTDSELQVGLIGWQFGDLSNHAIRVTDNFGVSFPLTMEIKSKALVLATYFFVDLLYFENKFKLNFDEDLFTQLAP